MQNAADKTLNDSFTPLCHLCFSYGLIQLINRTIDVLKTFYSMGVFNTLAMCVELLPIE